MEKWLLVPGFIFFLVLAGFTICVSSLPRLTRQCWFLEKLGMKSRCCVALGTPAVELGNKRWQKAGLGGS